MEVVRFAFRDHPQLDDLAARRLADNLSTRRNLAATRAVGKLRAELQKAPEERGDIELTELELEQVIDVLSGEVPRASRHPAELDQLRRLLEEASAAYTRGEWAQEPL